MHKCWQKYVAASLSNTTKLNVNTRWTNTVSTLLQDLLYSFYFLSIAKCIKIKRFFFKIMLFNNNVTSSYGATHFFNLITLSSCINSEAVLKSQKLFLNHTTLYGKTDWLNICIKNSMHMEIYNAEESFSKPPSQYTSLFLKNNGVGRIQTYNANVSVTGFDRGLHQHQSFLVASAVLVQVCPHLCESGIQLSTDAGGGMAPYKYLLFTSTCYLYYI